MHAISLDHSHISQALVVSPDGGKTLDFSALSLTEVSGASAEELSRVGAQTDDDIGTVTR